MFRIRSWIDTADQERKLVLGGRQSKQAEGDEISESSLALVRCRDPPRLALHDDPCDRCDARIGVVVELAPREFAAPLGQVDQFPISLPAALSGEAGNHLVETFLTLGFRVCLA